MPGVYFAFVFRFVVGAVAVLFAGSPFLMCFQDQPGRYQGFVCRALGGGVSG